MRLTKVEIFTGNAGQSDFNVLVEPSTDLLQLVGLLETTKQVHSYRVFDLEILLPVGQHHYGYGDCPKWTYDVCGRCGHKQVED